MLLLIVFFALQCELATALCTLDNRVHFLKFLEFFLLGFFEFQPLGSRTLPLTLYCKGKKKVWI